MKMPSRTARLFAAAAVAGAGLLAPTIALAASSSPARQASPAVVPCQTPGLVIWFNPNGNGAAGSTFYHLRFTNLSGHRCTLNGFPFLFAINLAGRQVGHRAAFSGHAHAVTLARGGTVHAVLKVVDVFNFPPTSCHRVTAAGFKVFPPNQTRAKTVPFPFPACSLRTHVFLFVSGLTRGF
jgi:hypothetical protein